jgi:hypothetical protein
LLWANACRPFPRLLLGPGDFGFQCRNSIFQFEATQFRTTRLDRERRITIVFDADPDRRFAIRRQIGLAQPAMIGEFSDGRLTGGLAEGSPKPGGPLVILYADDLAETQRRLEVAGAKIVKPVFAFPGGRRFHFQDPDGYELAVWSDK